MCFGEVTRTENQTHNLENALENALAAILISVVVRGWELATISSFAVQPGKLKLLTELTFYKEVECRNGGRVATHFLKRVVNIVP